MLSTRTVLRWISLYLLVVFFWQIQVSRAAQQKVVLLTSLDLQAIQLPWYLKFRQSYYKQYELDLEFQFSKNFQGLGYEIEIHHRADEFDLWSALHDSRNIAVFWISHAGGKSNSNLIGYPESAIQEKGSIPDVCGFDISPVFTEIHPNLRFLGIIGCFSQQVLQQLQTDHLFDSHPKLKTTSFEDEVDAKKGLSKAIQDALPILHQPENQLGYTSACETRRGFPIHVERKFSRSENKTKELLGSEVPSINRPSVRIEDETGRVLGIFPPALSSRKSQFMDFYLPVPKDLKRARPSLKVNAGSNFTLKEDFFTELGRFRWFAPWAEKLWEVWKDKKHGLPIGITDHLFELPKNTIDFTKITGFAEDYRPFSCDPMPGLKQLPLKNPENLTLSAITKSPIEEQAKLDLSLISSADGSSHREFLQSLQTLGLDYNYMNEALTERLQDSSPPNSLLEKLTNDEKLALHIYTTDIETVI